MLPNGEQIIDYPSDGQISCRINYDKQDEKNPVQDSVLVRSYQYLTYSYNDDTGKID